MMSFLGSNPLAIIIGHINRDTLFTDADDSSAVGILNITDYKLVFCLVLYTLVRGSLTNRREKPAWWG